MTGDRSRETAEEGIDSKSTLPLEIVFRALADQRRRTVLYYLTSCTHSVTLEELVDTVAIHESESHAGDIPAEVYEEVAIDLHHTQLPKLAEWGIIDYDTDRKLATVAKTLRPLDEYLRIAEQHDHKQVQTNDRP